MAVGDVVNGLFNTGSLTFQPAAGVEVCITSCMSWSSNIMMTNGVTEVYAAGASQERMNTKMMINNTNFIKMLGANNNSYSGIQIK